MTSRVAHCRIVALSGHIASGKSTLAKTLEREFGCIRVSTRELILQLLPRTEDARSALQRAGEVLDRKTSGRWVADAVARRGITQPEREATVIVDSVRIREQIDGLRRAYGARVLHLHLMAPDAELAKRFRRRQDRTGEAPHYGDTQKNSTESRVNELADIADVVIDTKLCSVRDVVVRAAAHLGFYGRAYRRLVDVLVGGEYGSEGKGHIAAYLARDYDMLVRVGGPNAGHTVFGNPPYTHHLLPSGTQKSNAALVIGPGAVLDVPKLLQEIADCGVTSERLSIDPQAAIISPEDAKWEMAHLRESIGSTAQGGGRAAARRILYRRLSRQVKLARDIKPLQPYLRETVEVLDRAFERGERIMLEGTQGTGLSLYHGEYPYVTSRDTTVSGCLAEAGIAPSRVRRTIMVCRTYPIRVAGPSGGIGAEISWAEVARRSGIAARKLARAERTSTTNRRRRVGEFDWALLRKAASLNGPTDIALTFADYLAESNQQARRFEQLGRQTIRFIEEVEKVASAPVSLISVRFAHRSIIDRRAW
jgi:adenylosuccinate synthase